MYIAMCMKRKAAWNCLKIKIFYVIQSITYNNLKIKKIHVYEKHALKKSFIKLPYSIFTYIFTNKESIK